MPWPLSQDYNEAIQNPRSSFGDPELQQGSAVVTALGLPRPLSGNFADVYEVACPATGGRWAVKCFTREVPGLRDRYAAVSRHLYRARLPFTVEFSYQEQGVRIRGQWYPVLKMKWVEGRLLNDFMRDALDQPALLDALAQVWGRLGRGLRTSQIVHGDLQHGNVLLVPGRTPSALAMKLIDYDGMWVPALAGAPTTEVGHPAYQHPQRKLRGVYGPLVDRFPLLLVSAALRSVAVGGRALWERYDNGDNLLFREADLAAPGESELFRELWQMQDGRTHTLMGHLTWAALQPLEETPLAYELLSDGRLPPLTRAQEDRVTALLGPRRSVVYLGAPPVRVPHLLPSAEPVEEPPPVALLLEEPPRRRWRGASLLALVFALLLLVGAIATTIILARGNPEKSTAAPPVRPERLQTDEIPGRVP